tara:strand:- start:1511 stop:2401 length:891 start_codon:yes stop_codon:yes gene_type:complete
MKLIIFFSIIYLPISLLGQEHQFLPKWKEGEMKTISSERKTQFYANDSLMGERSVKNEYSIKVLKENKDHYEIDIYIDNIALTRFNEYLQSESDLILMYKTVTLNYLVDKKTGDKTLSNWDEVSKLYKESMNYFSSIIDDEDPESYKLDFHEISVLSKSIEEFNVYFSNNYVDIFILYNKPLQVGEIYTEIDSIAHPFTPRGMTLQTKEFAIESIIPEKNICNVSINYDIDLNETKKLNSRQGPNEDRVITMDQNHKIKYNMKSHWIETIDISATLTVSDSRGKKHQLITKTVSIK